MIGIYKITNIVNGKVYIGSSKNVEDRINKHKSNLKLSSFNITRCLKLNNTYKNYKWYYSAPLYSNIH